MSEERGSATRSSFAIRIRLEPTASGLGLPDEEFDYDKFAKEEFGSGHARPHGISWFWWLIAALVAILVSFALLSGTLGL
jgi:hypothetical protein